MPNKRLILIFPSSDWIILAFCKDHSVGVDLEAIRDIDFLRISKRHFSQGANFLIIQKTRKTFFDLCLQGGNY